MKIGTQKLFISMLFSAGCTLLLTIYLQAQEASIGGRVVDNEGNPLWGVALHLSPSNQKTITDRYGQFVFKLVDDGRRRIAVASAPGYYEEEAINGHVVSDHVGDTVTIRLTKGGVITGRISDESGEPIVGISVHAYRVRGEKGELVKTAESYTGYSDDRGVYRLYGLKTGTYFVAAKNNESSYYLPSIYRFNALNWHPLGVRETAVEIKATAASITEGIDILYRNQQGYIVSGTVAMNSGDGPKTSSSVNLFERASGLLLQKVLVDNLRGGFAIYGVADGEYEVEAEALGTPNQSHMISPRRRLQVAGKNISGLRLSPTSLGLIRGKVQLEPTSGISCGRPFPLSKLSIDVAKELRKNEGPRFTSAETAVDLNGTFILYDLFSGQYRLSLSGLGDEWYIKQIRGVLDNSETVPVNASRQGSDVVITLAPGAAKISGKTAVKSQIYLIPTNQLGTLKVRQVRTTRTQTDGVFTISHLAPGSYYVFSRGVKGDEEEKGVSVEDLPQLKKEAAKASLVELNQCQQRIGITVP